MTNDPANIAALLRTLIVYAVCVVVAIIIGVLMTNPLTYSSLGFVGVMCAVLFLPILLRWHHPLMIICYCLPVYCFFLKGDPKLCLVMIALSFTISIVERALNQRHFLSVPQVTWPLMMMIVVVVITAKLTGGIGLKAFGSDVIGGKKYVFLVVGIIGYFALVARPIPPEKARLYITLYFGVGAISFIGDFYSILPGFFHPLFWLIPPSVVTASGTFEVGTTRLVNTGWAAVAVVNALIAAYGMRGIFLSGKLWRPAVFFICIMLIGVGGFRSGLVLTAFTVILQFFLEGMHRTRLMPVFIIGSLACAAALVPLAPKLPYTFQRTLAFLPSDWVHLSPEARLEAQGSLNWRIDMWNALLPQIPKHLLLGKGYAISAEDAQMMGQDVAFHSIDASQQGLALSSDYHNGPLSVILPFGLWGVIAFGWFLIASNWVVYRNFRYGDPSLRTLNTFLFTMYVVSTVDFLFLFGSLADGIGGFAGILGLSICINRGVCRIPAQVASSKLPVNIRFGNVRSRPRPALQNKTTGSQPL